MRCVKCGCSCYNKTLYRTNPIGETPEWMCMDCLEKYEPELAKNTKEDSDMELLNIIKNESKKIK